MSIKSINSPSNKEDKRTSIWVEDKRTSIWVEVCTPQSTAWLVIGVFNLCQHFEISYSRYANKHYITGVYLAINDIYR